LKAYNDLHGNITASLFAVSLAVLEHRNISIALPLLKHIRFPLTFESQDDFEQRHERLPSELYIRGKDDKDKLQHFFVSAYLQRVVKMNWFVRLLGTVLEAVEQVFIVDGEYDIRDIQANNDGILFASHLTDTLLLPGQFFARTKK
jgi:hypothetical protein